MFFNDLKDLLDERLEQSNLNIDGKQLIGALFLAVLLIIGGFFYYLRSKPKPVKQDIFSTKSGKPALEKKETQPKKDLIIHVCGAVRKPGVIKLKKGDRVVDALNLAGGATEDAGLDVLNLAAKLSDGQRVYVPRQGEQVNQEMMGSIAGSSPEQASLVNINSASATELESLPGVGPVLAQRIMEYRESEGGFSSVEQLRKVEGIGPKKFEQLKDKVTID